MECRFSFKSQCLDRVRVSRCLYFQIVLQVEEDNPNAKRFYENRGYQVVFSDPTCRRFDASGVWVKKVRATKVCMRKDLAMKRLLRIPSNDREIRENGLFRLNWWQNFRDRL